jgi:uncharacterized protein
MEARVLLDSDLDLVQAFLRKHADSSMILRGNLLLDGIEAYGERYGGVYAGAFDGNGELRAVAAHFRRSGNLFPQAETEAGLAAAVRCAVAASAQPVRGLIGPRALARRARSLLNLDDAPARYDCDEGLYALDLALLREPPLLAQPEIALRALQPSDAERLIAWHRDYDVSSLGASDDAELLARSREGFERDLARGERCLLTCAGVPCAMTNFNARLPDMVQVGGVYTPPEQRSRGYARTAVAASLLDARARGVQRAILFTGEDNIPAIRAYHALGFERIDDYAIVLF